MALWPLGVWVLDFTIGSGRMGCGYHAGYSGHWQHKMERLQRKMDWMRSRMSGSPSSSSWSGPWNYGPLSGNRAFDEYRTDTLRRLEEEQPAFSPFLGRLAVSEG